MPLLMTTTGFETFAQSSAKVYAFHLPSREFPGRELNLGIAARAASNIIQAVGAPNNFPCGAGIRPEMGRWTTQNYDIQEGVLIKVFAHRSGGFGQMRTMASLILRMRSTAALRRVGAILTGNVRATISRALFEGRFDILALHEAEALGVMVPPSFRNTFEDVQTRRAFEITLLERETAAAQMAEQRTVTNSSGEETKLTVLHRPRALDL